MTVFGVAASISHWNRGPAPHRTRVDRDSTDPTQAAGGDPIGQAEDSLRTDLLVDFLGVSPPGPATTVDISILIILLGDKIYPNPGYAAQ